MNLDLDRCTAFAKQVLSPDRFEHSVGTMQVMNELAPIYGLDPTAARVAGILHDAAKELTVEDQLELVSKSNIQFSTPYDRHPMFLHGAAGACYITRELGITDPLILEAIWRHCYWGSGAAVSPVFCWCLRFADVLEPTRDWKDTRRRLSPVIYAGKLKEGAYQLMAWIIPFLGTKSVPVHPNMHRVLNELAAFIKEGKLDAANRLPV